MSENAATIAPVQTEAAAGLAGIDAWYVVARSVDISSELSAHAVHGRPVAMYRTSSGEVVAFPDYCPHRGYPLSAGALVGDQVQCGYHGFTFDTTGTCVRVPGQTAIPSKANLAAIPVVERGPFVWLWTGDPAKADLTPVPGGEELEDPAWTIVTGLTEIACESSLLIDNVLDLSHETYIHPNTIGSDEVAETPLVTTVDEATGVVYSERLMRGVICPPFFQKFTGLRTPIDRGQRIEFMAPSMYLLHITVAQAEANGADAAAASNGAATGADASNGAATGADATGTTYRIRVFYAITPMGDGRTSMAFAFARDFALDDAALSDTFESSQWALIHEDIAALEKLQKHREDFGAQAEVSIKIDTGGLAARRSVQNVVGA